MRRAQFVPEHLPVPGDFPGTAQMGKNHFLTGLEPLHNNPAHLSMADIPSEELFTNMNKYQPRCAQGSRRKSHYFPSKRGALGFAEHPEVVAV